MVSLSSSFTLGLYRLGGALKRIFLDFNGTNAFVELSEPWTPVGDFVVEFDLSTTSGTGYPIPISTSNPNVDGAIIFIDQASGFPYLKLGVSSVFSQIGVLTDVTDGLLHSMKIRRVNDDFFFSVDGGTESTVNAAVTVMDFNAIGKFGSPGGSQYFKGVIANVVMRDIRYENDVAIVTTQLSTYGDVTGVQSATNATITLGTTSATLTGTVVTKDDAAITYGGGFVVDVQDSGYPKNQYKTSFNLSFDATNRTTIGSIVTFNTDATKFEINAYGSSDIFRLLVDGEYMGEFTSHPNDGSLKYVLVDLTAKFLTNVSREIRIEYQDLSAFGGLVLETGASITALSSGDSICFLGDSFVEGSGVTGSTRSSSLVGVASKQLGYNDYAMSGFGGTGYIRPFDPGFGLLRPSLQTRIGWDAIGYDAYVIAMGLNDTEATITTDINTTFDTIRSNNATQPIFVLGTWGDGSGGIIKPNVEASIEAAVGSRVGFYFIPVYQVNFTKSDGTHPDEAGHKILGDYIASQILAITNNLEFSLDEASQNWELPVGNVMGAELWTSPTLGVWIDDGGGAYSLVGNGTNQPISIPSVIGENYLVNFTVDALSGGNLVIYCGATEISALATGTYSVVFEALDTTLAFVRQGTGTINTTISNVSIQSVQNAAIYNNIDTDDRFEAQLVSSNWVGVDELVTNGDFSVDSDWSKGTGWTISGGTASSDGTQGGNSDLTQASTVLSGNVYTTTYTSTRSAGNSTVLIGTTEGTDRALTGTYTEIVTSAGTAAGIRADLNFVGDIDNVSVKRYLEVATQA